MRLSATGRMAAAAICLALVQTVPAAAQDGAQTFDMANMETLIGILGDPNKALSPDIGVALQHWEALIPDQMIFTGVRSACSTLVSVSNPPRGVGSIDLTLLWQPKEKLAECGRESSEANLSIAFASAADAKTFRQALVQRIGAPDPRCSNDAKAHWRLKPGLSLRWDATSWIYVSVSLLGADPPDANCAAFSVPERSLLDEASLSGLFARVKAAPPPWSDPTALERWLSSYGHVERDKGFGCEVSVSIFKPEALAGIGSIMSTIRPAECDRSEQQASADSPSRMFFLAGDFDMFAEMVAEGHDDFGDVWKISDTVTAILVVRPLGVILVDLPLAEVLERRR